jgi:hypothetical protein
LSFDNNNLKLQHQMKIPQAQTFFQLFQPLLKFLVIRHQIMIRSIKKLF